MLKPNYSIESLNPKDIDEVDLKKITEIEQDMWAREDGIGEYVKCCSCGKIHSKEDIFGYLSNDVKTLTVAKIEETLAIDKIACTICDSTTDSLYDRNEYIEEIRDRYTNSIESFLTVYRDGSGEIRGFEDGYIEDYDKIFEREFALYYSKIGSDTIKNMIESIINGSIPKQLLMCSSVGMEQKYASFINLYNIMQNFFGNICEKREKELLGIYEAVAGGLPHSIYHVAGVKRLGIPESDLYGMVQNASPNYKSDIFVHPNVAYSFSNILSLSVKDFLRKNRKIMKDVKIR